LPVFELYSRRKRKAEQGDPPEVYQYDEVPRAVRVQIIRIWQRAIGPYSKSQVRSNRSRGNANVFWKQIHDAFAEEKGLFALSSEAETPFTKCVHFLMSATTVEDCLDIIDYTFNFISTEIDAMVPWQHTTFGIIQPPEEAIEELNVRLREAGVGYQFENGQLIRIDFQFLHQEVVRPALQILRDPLFAGAQEEFLNAHAYYRSGENKDAIVNAHKAFESTLRVICDAKNWSN
jgi:hypothetical protein